MQTTGLKRLKLEVGNRYRVTKTGTSLTWAVPVGYCAWSFRSHQSLVGDILVYEGARHGIGSDTIPEDTFTCERTGIRGTFSPSSWGCADTSYLKELPTTGR